MKILTGALRGRMIPLKPNPNLRPTADKVRKAIFDALKDVPEGARTLDLFSGTGALGIEALSSGAESVTFVESDAAQARKIEDTLEKLGLSERAVVMKSDAFRAIESLGRHAETFDLFFLDPPYGEGTAARALEALAAAGVAERGAIAVLESALKESAPERAGCFKRLKEKEYGGTRVAFYRAE